MTMEPVNSAKMRKLEKSAREVGHALGRAIDQAMADGEHYGFALFVFSFGGSELTYISNAERATMRKTLQEFLDANSPDKTWDEQHG
jgi:hypothetical protein